jgi:hypothetical protein
MNIVYTIIPARTRDLQKDQIEEIIFNASLGRPSKLNYKQVNPDNSIKEEFLDFSVLPIFDGISEYVEYYENIMDIPYGININNMNIYDFLLRRDVKHKNGFINAFGGSEIFIALNLNKLNAKMKSNELLSLMSEKEKIRSGSKKLSKKKPKRSKKKKKKKSRNKDRLRSGIQENYNIRNIQPDVKDYQIAIQGRPDLFPQYVPYMKHNKYRNNLPSGEELENMIQMRKNIQ